MNGRRVKSALTTCPKIGLLWRTDVPTSPLDVQSARQWPIMAALRELGGEVEAIGYADETAGTTRDRLLTCDGVMVWADPISDAGDRSRLDPILREAAAAGVSISAHPDIIAKMGVKSVLHATRALGWGTDTHRYADLEELRALLLERLASGPRVLKENRSNGGRGVWRVEVADRGGGAQPIVSVLHAARDSVPFKIPLDALIARFAPYFERGECLIDQPFQPRLGDGMIRCYVSEGTVVGFGHQLIRALLPLPAEGVDSPKAQPGPRVMQPADAGAFQSLRDDMEQSWIPGLQHILAIEHDELPLLWDADFLYGPKDDRGSDSYVLCEINVSSVAPFPPSAVRQVADAAYRRAVAAHERRVAGRGTTASPA